MRGRAGDSGRASRCRARTAAWQRWAGGATKVARPGGSGPLPDSARAKRGASGSTDAMWAGSGGASPAGYTVSMAPASASAVNASPISKASRIVCASLCAMRSRQLSRAREGESVTSAILAAVSGQEGGSGQGYTAAQTVAENKCLYRTICCVGAAQALEADQISRLSIRRVVPSLAAASTTSGAPCARSPADGGCKSMRLRIEM